ncbi:uncharacterized protein ARMOST_17716 [Armillaria ostoyae]|uniref:Uncharacterized protein n=1 Tax=Armillaria ostoyae TaxID=47428 RepID=A0A284RZT4_ARMOS|nr:uncharacterized protein ARMOST_17716 [Armillaria ostoyae]
MYRRAEGGMSAIATASGMSAPQFVALLTLASAGDNIVSSPFLYGDSQNQLKVIFKKFGIQARFVRTDKVEDYAGLVDGKTKAIYTESISSSPAFLVAPIKELVELAHSHHLPLVVDDTLGMSEPEAEEERQLREEDSTNDEHCYPPHHKNTASMTHKDDTLATHSTASGLEKQFD